MTVRSPRIGRERWFDVASLCCLGVAAVVVLATWRDYGVTWDEPVHMSYGDAVLRTLESLGEDMSGARHRDRMYGPGYDLLGAIVRKHSPLGDFTTMHLLGAFVGLVGAMGAWRLGRLLAGPLGGLLALAFLLLTPVYYGHAFANPKDIPFAVAYVWSLFHLARIAEDLPRVSMGTFVWAGVSIAAAMSTRIAGFVLVLLLAAVVLVRLTEHALTRPGLRAFACDAARSIAAALFATALAYALLIAIWPFTWEDPLGGPFQSVERFSQYKGWDFTTLYDGRWLKSDQLPWTYLPRYFAYQAPEPVVVFGALGVLGVLAVSLARLARLRTLPLAWGLVAAAALGPPVGAILKGVLVYDGIRQFLFVVPAFCVLAGATAATTLDFLAARSKAAAVVLALALALAGADTLRSMAELHPLEYVHFNRFLGGIEVAQDRWDTDYYGAGFKEAHAMLREHLWSTERERYLSGTYDFTSTAAAFFHTNQTTENFRFRGLRGDADFYVTYTRHEHHRRYGRRPVLVEVKRGGRTLGLVKDLR